MNASTVAVRAHAKINLDLRILGRRADGYHELRTIFQSVALHDTLMCESREGPLVIECAAPGVPLDRTNLVWRAAAGLWRALGRDGDPSGVGIRLEKRIPLQAGLGGGSADAAAALLGLARLWGAQSGAVDLVSIGASVGADVPFFLSGGTALGLGRGDDIYPLVDLPHCWILLLIPPFGVSTRDAFAWYHAGREVASDVAPEPHHVPGPWPAHLAQMVNDLEAPIVRHHPEIARMKAALRQHGARAAAMTGSGSTVFGLFDDREDAGRAAAALAHMPSQVLLTHSLGRAEYARRSRPVVRRHAGTPKRLVRA